MGKRRRKPRWEVQFWEGLRGVHPKVAAELLGRAYFPGEGERRWSLVEVVRQALMVQGLAGPAQMGRVEEWLSDPMVVRRSVVLLKSRVEAVVNDPEPTVRVDFREWLLGLGYELEEEGA